MKYFNIDHTKYLSLILVLSFFVLQKIYLVLVGIIIALFDLNRNYIINLIQFHKKASYKKGIDRSINIEPETIDIKNKLNSLNLVEKIEELGYIPSIKKENDTNAA